MHATSNQVVLEFKKTGLRVLNELEMQSVGSGVAGEDRDSGGTPVETDVTSVSTRGG